MPKVRAIIQARMLSSRLRGKSLLAVAGKPLLVRVVERVAQMPFVRETVIATTDQPADLPIVAMARELGCRCIRGDTDDVLSRFVLASPDLVDTDIVARCTADNPLYDPLRSAEAYAASSAGDFDYTHIEGLSHVVPEYIRVGALRQAHREARSQFDREHVTPLLRDQRDSFRVLTLPSNFAGLRPDLDARLTIDELGDLIRIEKMLLEIEPTCDFAQLDDCYRWLDLFNNHRREGALSGRVRIADSDVGSGAACFIVAEIGQNHNGQMDLAKRLIEMAARCGCDAVKFQKRDIAWDLTREEYQRPYENPNSFGSTYGEHREFLELNEDQHVELRSFAADQGLTYFCTACDPPSVEIMERVGNPCYKIASRDIENVPLLRRVRQTGKPVIVSTGMAGLVEIRTALDELSADPAHVILTHCVSQYPTELKNVNLRAIETLRKEFDLPVGLSDHTTGIASSMAAAVMGACYLEKHITASRALPGTDHAAALEEEGIRRLVKYVREMDLATGSGRIEIPSVVEASRRKLSRSLVSRGEISSGTRLSEEMLILKSPGTGLSWRQRDRIVGKIARHDIAADVTLRESHFE